MDGDGKEQKYREGRWGVVGVRAKSMQKGRGRLKRRVGEEPEAGLVKKRYVSSLGRQAREAMAEF